MLTQIQVLAGAREREPQTSQVMWVADSVRLLSPIVDARLKSDLKTAAVNVALMIVCYGIATSAQVAQRHLNLF